MVGISFKFNWRRRFPAAQWLPQLRDPKVVRTEILAGVYVALILIPQAVAYAQLAGLPPEVGLAAACLPVAVAALFGAARPLQGGPTSLIALMTAAALGPLAVSGGAVWIAYALTLALLVGLFQVAIGVLRLGHLVNFLANPVAAGFASANGPRRGRGTARCRRRGNASRRAVARCRTANRAVTCR